LEDIAQDLKKLDYSKSEDVHKSKFLRNKYDELKSQIVDIELNSELDSDEGSITPKYFKSPPLDTSNLPVEKNPFSDVTD
jgi:hypothetical protein